MFAKIFVLIAIALGPEGNVMTYQSGSYETVDSCQAAQKQLREESKQKAVPQGRLFTLCIQTPWDVKGQRGA